LKWKSENLKILIFFDCKAGKRKNITTKINVFLCLYCFKKIKKTKKGSENMLENNIKALESKVNIKLYNSIVSFVADSRNKAADMKNFSSEIKKSPLYNEDLSSSADITELYDVRYVGELYERYSEKGIADIRDIRALTLALADTVMIQCDEMFVGTQKTDFINGIKEMYDDKFDVYLGTALVKLMGSAGSYLCREVLEKHYTDTEDLLFVTTIASEDTAGDMFNILKDRLTNLLGKNRSISVLGNAGLYGLFVDKFNDFLKKYRKKDVQLFKAICALAEKRLNKDTAQYKALRENGYSHKDILYLNYFISKYVSNVSEKLSEKTITYQKAAVNYCKCLLSLKNILEDEEKEIFLNLLNKYKKFKIKCDGSEKIADCLKDEKIGCADTFIWFLNLDKRLRPSDRSPVFIFDILEEKSGDIIKDLNYEQKSFFLNRALCRLSGDNKETAEKYIAEFEKYDGFNYFDSFNDSNMDDSAFSMLVEWGIIDILQYADNMENVADNLCSRISTYVSGIRSITAYDFFEKFDQKYGLSKVRELLKFNFYESFFVSISGCRYSDKKLNISRNFLTREQHRYIFGWITEDVFYNEQEKYTDFIFSTLTYEKIDEYYTYEELHELFNVSKEALKERYNGYYFNSLCEKYLTEEEKEQDKAEKEKLKQLEEEEKSQEAFTSMLSEFKKLFDGSFKSIDEFIKRNCRWSSNKGIGYKISLLVSEEIMRKTDCFDEDEAIALCDIYFNALNNSETDYKTFAAVVAKSDEIIKYNHK